MQTLRHDRSTVARWMLAAIVVALVIVGLLGMHTLTADHAEAAPGVATAADHRHPSGGHVDTTTPGGHTDSTTSVACECGSSESHEAMIMTCVLGLLAGVALLVRVAPRLRLLRAATLGRIASHPIASHRPSRPSRWELSISRT